MEIEGVHNLIEQGHSEQRTCFMLNDNNFSQSALPELDTEKLFDKLSPSKAMLVGDCSKRALPYDGKLVVPPKKRKQMQEEFDLCDASIDQNLQKSEFNEDMTPCQKFGQENIYTSTSSTSEKELGENKIEFNLQSSVYVKADDSADWIKLKCFESITVDGSNSATFFAGGPIQSSAFSLMPHDRKVNQYIALAAGNVINNKLSCNDTKNVSGIIQFWNVGSLHERKTLNQSPTMELALYHDNGIITQMKWCPADCYDKHPSTCHLPRLGLLAASSTNSCVYIYSVPQPDSMPKLKPTLPIYFTLPFMKLIPLFGGPSFATRKAVATCIEWETNGEQIVAGYANGAVCVWMIKGSSFTSSITMKNAEPSYIIQPYLFFQASGAAITSFSFAPFNNRWLVVSSIDKVIRFFDLQDTSAPFHVVKQGLENNCIWSDAFCGVYSTPSVNSVGLISLSIKDCCSESNDKGVQKGLFDSSTYIAVSKKKNLHAVADMGGAVIVNFLKNIDKPLETSYLTYMIFETEIMTLDDIDQELESSECKIKISGSIPSNDVTSDTRDTFYSKKKQGSSSSSSGFCSPNFGKTIVIETGQCFDDDAANLLDSPAKSSSMNDFKDINDNIMKTSLNNPLCYSDEGTNDEMIKSSQSSEDLMHHLLMVKISNQSKSSSHLFPFNTSNNSASSDSKGAKDLSDKALNTSLATSYTGDTIIYPIEPCFCDTSHPNAQSESLNGKGNTVHKTTMHKKNGETALKSELCTESNLNFSSVLKSGNSHPSENLSSKNWCEPVFGRCNLNDNQFTSTHSDIHREECYVSSKSSKEIMKSGETVSQSLDTKGEFIFEKDAENPLCNVLKSNNLNQPKCLPDICSSIASNNFIICDKDDQQVSDRALIQSSAASDYSGDTIISFRKSHDCDTTDADYLKMLEAAGTFQSLYKSEKVNTFQDSFLHKINKKEVIIHGSETKVTENCSSFAREKYEHFLTKELLKYNNSGYGTNSSSQGFHSSDEDRILFPADFLISDFQLLHTEYLSEKSEKKYTRLNEDPQELSYKNLIANFGVVFKDSLDKFANPLKRRENDIYIGYNPLSVIKTIAWDPNEGCQSWLFIGGNSGIGRLVYVPDFAADNKKKPQRTQKRSVY